MSEHYNKKYSLQDLSLWQLEYLHRAIVSYLQTGEGFHNSDIGHPVYLSGDHEDTSMGAKYGGEAHTNEPYLLLKKIETKIFGEIGEEKYFQETYHQIKPVENWSNFCKLLGKICEERNHI